MLLTGRQLITELSRLGLKSWDSSAPRRWITEDPPCPIAEHADRGQPHRYRAIDVLNWLLERERRAKAKGYTSGQGAQLADRIELALRHFVAGTAPAAAPSAAPLALPVVPQIEGDADAPADSAPAVNTGPQDPTPFDALSDPEALLEILKGRNPALWNASEEALRKRRMRLEAEGKLVAAEEVEQMLTTQAIAMRSASQALVVMLAHRIPDHSTFDQRRSLVQAAVDDMLHRLASDDPALSAVLADAA